MVLSDRTPIAGLIVLAALAGCSGPTAPPAARAPPASAPPSPTDTAVTDGWIGQWIGPEGTFLRIERGPGQAGRYTITVRDLDRARRFEGRSAGDRIGFERDGAQAAIRATDGAGTGMKWLAARRDCLVIAPGEGYCRD